jgi:hypothetical protein
VLSWRSSLSCLFLVPKCASLRPRSASWRPSKLAVVGTVAALLVVIALVVGLVVGLPGRGGSSDTSNAGSVPETPPGGDGIVSQTAGCEELSQGEPRLLHTAVALLMPPTAFMPPHFFVCFDPYTNPYFVQARFGSISCPLSTM